MKKIMFIAVMCAFVAVPAFADLTPIREGVEGGSWEQRFQESGVGNFDLIAIRMTSAGDSFENAAFNDFSTGTWVLYQNNGGVNPTLASASGPSLNWLQFDIKFAGVSGNPLAFDFVAFSGNTLLETAHAVYPTTGPYGFTITAGTWTPTRAAVVPVPAAVLLGMLGLGAAGLKLRKLA